MLVPSWQRQLLVTVTVCESPLALPAPPEKVGWAVPRKAPSAGVERLSAGGVVSIVKVRVAVATFSAQSFWLARAV